MPRRRPLRMRRARHALLAAVLAHVAEKLTARGVPAPRAIKAAFPQPSSDPLHGSHDGGPRR
jgi:hypothetical protein